MLGYRQAVVGVVTPQQQLKRLVFIKPEALTQPAYVILGLRAQWVTQRGRDLARRGPR